MHRIWKNTWFSGHIDIEEPWDKIYGFIHWAVDRRREEGIRDFQLSHNQWDLIYARMLRGSIRDWTQLYKRIFEYVTLLDPRDTESQRHSARRHGLLI